MATQIQQYAVDLLQGGDSGNDDVDAIQPLNDGEGASQTVFRRPTENLRGRTEVTRSVLRDCLYYNSFAHDAIEGATGHSITWGGSVTSGGTGIITQTGSLTIRPFLAPGASQHGSLTVGTVGVNAVESRNDRASCSGSCRRGGVICCRGHWLSLLLCLQDVFWLCYLCSLPF